MPGEAIRLGAAVHVGGPERIAAVLQGCSAEREECCATYGQALGTAFQIIDDVLDYEGQAEEMGKNLGDDLREGKTTLPLIIAMQKATAEQAAVIRHAIEHGSVEALDEVVAIVRSTGSLADARVVAAAEADRAIAAIADLSDNAHAQALRALALGLQERRS